MLRDDKRYFDIVVIGAGPAGSTFARHVADAGFSVLVVDGQNDKTRKPCGGLLSPDAQEIFAKEGLTIPNEILADPQIFAVRTMDIEQNIVKDYQRFYLNMDRLAFDSFLLDMVPENVEKFSGRCTQIERKQDKGFKLTLVFEDKSREEIECSFLVGADGANSIVRKSFYPEIKQYVAIQEWFEKEDGDEMLFACVFDEKTSESCSWVIRKDEYLIYGGCFDMKTGRDDYERQLERFRKFSGLSLSKKIKREACLVNVPQKKKDFVTGKDGVYLIGEAAGFISASSFEGISNAMNSARYLSDSFKEVYSKENIERSTLHLSCSDSRCLINDRMNEADNRDLKAELSEKYSEKCKKLKKKLYMRILKKKLLFNPFTRKLIMRSGIQSL